MRGEFRYASEFIDSPRAFALDPLHLPLGLAPISTENPATGVHAVFEDSLPDAWGRAMMCRRYNIPRPRRRAAYLLELLGPEAMGALAYTPSPQWQEDVAMAELPDLADLVAAVDRYERDPDAPMDEMMRLFKAGSSPGGARPKVLIHDDGTHWMAKLPSINDTFDMVRVEAATLATARNAGIEVPKFTVLELEVRSALLIKRFDVTEHGGRNHVLSMKTLLGAENFYYLGYSDMADIVRQVSDEPGKDLQGLFRQSVFNALIGNTDDHLKNFAMMRSERGWHLTQAYDLLPDVNDNREHVLHFGTAGTTPTMDSLYRLGRVFGLSPKVGQAVISEALEAIDGFSSQCEAYSVPPQDVETLLNRMHLLKKK
ncbi:MAG: type II toxin-antitoxin system HipA family toxin [Candidatus Thiodiazotropha sp. (ex Dulcina madagascariensis)]|nr:type II toxin-antitoxin system HipA family toxin [Candidatus Thiodiazotropha sp. (ex Dulcina madagascariensis)]